MQYYIGFWGTRYDVNLIKSADVGTDIGDITDIDGDIDDINAKNHWPILAQIPRF